MQPTFVGAKRTSPQEGPLLAETIELPHDCHGYTRRACPRCHAHFKLRLSRRDERVVAAAIAARAGAAELTAGHAPPRHCPYCAEADEAEAFWTEEHLAWVEAQAQRLRNEVRWRRLRAPIEGRSRSERPTYLPLQPGGRPPALPRDPPDDLVAVPLPCCGEEEKVSCAWVGPVRCHYCGFVHARDLQRDIGLELALLRDWTEEP